MPSDPCYDDGPLDCYENGGADIVAVGDSWFHYPGSNLPESLNGALSRSFVITAYGESGAEEGGQEEGRIAAFLEERAVPPDAGGHG
jgi:hypothetical protein